MRRSQLTARVLMTGALTIALIGGSAMSASAALTSVSAGGGTHQYGIAAWAPHDRTNISNYYHKSVLHRSSVVNGFNQLVRSANASGGVWAKASQVATSSGNKAYWAHV